LVFASPRRLPKIRELDGRVVVLDIAFASEGIGKGFQKTTGKLIRDLGARLACWVDHHDHPRHVEYAADERFVLCTKAEHGACPEMIDTELVRRVGPVDTIVAHFDLDGLYAAAKWIRGGTEPYAGADDDARAVDTRIGELSDRADLVDKALRARYQDHALKQQVVLWLVDGAARSRVPPGVREAAVAYDEMAAGSARAAERYAITDGIARVELSSSDGPVDKTELLLIGQKIAQVAVVVDRGNATIAAPFDSGLDFVELLELGGGMPTRVNVPQKRLEDALDRITALLRQRSDAEPDPE
jgi:hypothetical protein